MSEASTSSTNVSPSVANKAIQETNVAQSSSNTSKTTQVAQTTSTKRKLDAVSSDNAASERPKKRKKRVHSTFGVERSKEKDRIKTIEKFEEEFEKMAKLHIEWQKSSNEAKGKRAKKLALQKRILPFLVHNLQSYKYHSKKQEDLYFTSTVVERGKTVTKADLYAIIEEELGPANRKLIEAKAKERAKERRQMRQTQFRFSKKKKKSEADK